MVPGLREVLDRFRAAGPPGPAAPVAVPADRRSLLLDEVAPVFAALAPVVEQARQIVATAAADADRIRAGAEREAELILGPADEQRDAAYRAAFAAARAAATERAGERAAQARRAAEQIDRLALARRDHLAELAAANAVHTLAPPDRMAVP